jgi:hypothetical protein
MSRIRAYEKYQLRRQQQEFERKAALQQLNLTPGANSSTGTASAVRYEAASSMEIDGMAYGPAAVQKVVEISRQEVKITQIIPPGNPLNQLRTHGRPVAVVRPYVPVTERRSVMLRQPRTDPLALQINPFATDPTLPNPIGRAARLWTLAEQRLQERANTVGRGRAAHRTERWHQERQHSAANANFLRSPGFMQLRGPTFNQQHAFADRSASVPIRNEHFETTEQQSQGRSNAMGLEPMQIDESPQMQTTHHQQGFDDFDDDDDDDDVVFMGFEL